MPGVLLNETVLWEGKPAPSIRWWVLSLIFFLLGGLLANYIFVSGLFVVALIFSLTVAILTHFTLRNSRYQITSRRIVASQRELPLEQMGEIRVVYTILDRLRGLGSIYFDGLVFKRVKTPESVKQIAADATLRLRKVPNVSSTHSIIREREIVREVVLIQCRHCGARFPQGTTRCSNCGANL